MSALRRRSIASVLLAAMLWLGVGAAISIGVSWGFAIHESRTRWERFVGSLAPYIPHYEKNPRWPATPPVGWPPAPSVAVLDESLGSTCITGLFSTPRETMFVGTSMWSGWKSDERRSGWPLMGMTYWGWEDTHTSPRTAAPVYEPCISGRWLKNWFGGESLPVIPLWPGFAVNTLFYAALAWGLWQVPLALRRRSRRRKGLCTHCAYDRTGIATDAPCPECGAKAVGG